MTSTYVNDLRLNEMATGDQSGSWGTVTNTNLELIAEAFSFGTEAITTNADTHTTTIADGATDPGRSMFLKYTGTLDSACTITLGPNTVSKLWFIENATSGSQNIIISQGSGANVTIPAGQTKSVYSDGAGSGAAIVDAFATLNVVDLLVDDDLTVTDDLIVGGDIDLEGSIDVNGTANLDIVDIDGAVDMASTLQVDGAITSSSGATITTTGNETQLTLTSTDADANSGPVLELYRNSASPAVSDALGFINFYGENDADEKTLYGQIRASIKDASDGTEDARFIIQTAVGGTQETSRVEMTGTETVINEDSKDLDFRVESNGNANMLFVDGGNDRVGIGTSSPSRKLEISGNNNAGAKANYIRITDTDTTATAGNQQGGIEFFTNDSTPGIAASIEVLYAGTGGGGELTFNTNASSSGTLTEAVRIDENGDVGIGTSSPSYKLDVASTVQIRAGESLRLQNVAGSAAATIQCSGAGGNSDLGFSTAGSERMRIDSSGNVGIGTSAPSYKLHVRGADATANLVVGNTAEGTQLEVLTYQDDKVVLRSNDSSNTARTLAFENGTSEAMRIDTSGNLLVGVTSAVTTGSEGVQIYRSGNAGTISTGRNTTSTASHHLFYNPNGLVGGIKTSGSATAYNTSSDYRLKTDAQPMTGASARVQALNPVNFKWIADDTRVDGFLAHEAQAVVPECVTGTKDAMRDEEYQVSAATGDIYTAGAEAGFNEVSAAIEASPAYYDVDGNIIKAEVIAQAAVHEAYDAVEEVIHSTNVEQPETLEDGQQWRETTPVVMGTRSVPDMQGIDQSKMVPLLVASLQEALARITALENA